MAATVSDMWMESAAPVLMSSRRFFALSCFQNSRMDKTVLPITQMLMLIFRMLKATKSATSGMSAIQKFGRGVFLS